MEQDPPSSEDPALRPSPGSDREADRRAMLEQDDVALGGLSAEDAMPQPVDPASGYEPATDPGLDPDRPRG